MLQDKNDYTTPIHQKYDIKAALKADWNSPAILSLAAASLCIYAYVLPTAPGGSKLLQAGLYRFLGEISSDLPGYALRFTASALLLGLLPLLGMLLIEPGMNFARSMGLSRPAGGLRSWKPFFFIWPAIIIAAAASAFDGEIADFYPYSRYLTLEAPSFGFFLLHALLYVVFYYLPWELLFRGILILPLINRFDIKPSIMLALASLQVIPSSLLHFGHPLSESLGAVVFGIIAAWTVLHYRSIWPALILHASAGISLDLTLTLLSVL